MTERGMRPITEAEWGAMETELQGEGLTFEAQRERQDAIDDALVELVGRFGAGAVLLRMRAIYELFPAAKAAAADAGRAGEQATRAMSERQRRADASRELGATEASDDWAIPRQKPKMTLKEARQLLGG